MNVKVIFANIKYRFFNRSLVSVGANSFLHYGGTFITNQINSTKLKGIIIGSNSYIGRNFNLHTGSSITLGKNTVLSDYVYMSTLSHGLEPGDTPIMQQECFDKGCIVIGDNSFLGFGVIVLPNVKIGDWCIVGAGSVVSKSFPDFCMLAGNPAKIIKTYCLKDKVWKPYK